MHHHQKAIPACSPSWRPMVSGRRLAPICGALLGPRHQHPHPVWRRACFWRARIGEAAVWWLVRSKRKGNNALRSTSITPPERMAFHFFYFFFAFPIPPMCVSLISLPAERSASAAARRCYCCCCCYRQPASIACPLHRHHHHHRRVACPTATTTACAAAAAAAAGGPSTAPAAPRVGGRATPPGRTPRRAGQGAAPPRHASLALEEGGDDHDRDCRCRRLVVVVVMVLGLPPSLQTVMSLGRGNA